MGNLITMNGIFPFHANIIDELSSITENNNDDTFQDYDNTPSYTHEESIGIFDDPRTFLYTL